jgi:hypothetical protein
LAAVGRIDGALPGVSPRGVGEVIEVPALRVHEHEYEYEYEHENGLGEYVHGREDEDVYGLSSTGRCTRTSTRRYPYKPAVVFVLVLVLVLDKTVHVLVLAPVHVLGPPCTFSSSRPCTYSVPAQSVQQKVVGCVGATLPVGSPPDDVAAQVAGASVGIW